MHFYDAHSPYAPPEPYRTRFAGRPYLGELAFVDSQIGRIRSFLESRRLLEKTVIVIVGDHGESLGEHGESTHGFFVYESVLHVPLLIRAPYDSLRGRRVADVVRSVDVMPTALDLLGVPLADKVDGQSVVPLMTGAVRELGLTAYAEAVYPRYHYGWSELRTVTSERFKYIDAPRPELYDLVQDPHETRNLYGERRVLADRLASVLNTVDAGAVADAAPAVDVDPDARARLAALGYVGTFVSTPVADRSRHADPKDKIELFNLVITARERLQDDHDSEGGLRALREAVSKDPNVIDAWLLMGNEYSNRREFTKALDSYKHALALKPDYDLAVFNLANLYRTMGRDEDALVGYRQLLARDPKNAQAHQEIAQVLVDHGRLDEGEQELQRALELEPAMAAARNTLGALRLKQGDLAVGEREIRAALAQKPDLAARPLQSGARRGTARRPDGRGRGIQQGNRTAPAELHGAVQSGKGVRASRQGRRSARGVQGSDRVQPRFRRRPSVPREAVSRSWTAGGGGQAGAPRHGAAARGRLCPAWALRDRRRLCTRRADSRRRARSRGGTPAGSARQEAVTGGGLEAVTGGGLGSDGGPDRGRTPV